jgi:hypothetical protein
MEMSETVSELVERLLAATHDAACDQGTAEDSRLALKLERELLDRIQSLTAERDALREALTKCRGRFYEYADSHTNKGTTEGDAKAARNMEMAQMCDAALKNASGEVG